MFEKLLEIENLYRYLKVEYNLTRTDVKIIISSLKNDSLYLLGENLEADRSLISRRVKRLLEKEFLHKRSESKGFKIVLLPKAHKVLNDIKVFLKDAKLEGLMTHEGE